jgi:ligand-binding sensor domain-containing protein
MPRSETASLSFVNRVIQGSRGYLWLATLGGWARFEGIRFREYSLPPNLRGQEGKAELLSLA